MSRFVAFAAVAAVLVLAVGLAALALPRNPTGVGSGPAPSPTASPAPSPSSPPGASPSVVASPAFFDSAPGYEPPIRLTQVGGWTRNADPNPGGTVDVLHGQADIGIMSIAALTVRGPTPTSKMVPWPDDIHAWLAGRPEFRPAEPRATTVGGRPATIIDFDFVVGPTTDTGDWIQYGPNRPNGWNLKGSDGHRGRLVVVETGPHAGIVAYLEQSSADFDAEAAALDGLLATLTFR